MQAPPDTDDLIRHGTPAFRRTALAMFSAGFATFALLYCVQPLLPVFAREFGLTAAQSSLSLSLTTGLLAPAMIVAGAVSEARGRTPLMIASLLASSMLTIFSALATRWHVLLVFRAIAGITFAGLPAISMAYLSEEVHPQSIGFAMGLAIGGKGLGGMMGRLITSFITDLSSWRVAMGVIGLLGLTATVITWRTMPASRHFVPRPLRLRALMRTFWEELRDPGLAALYAAGFLLMGAFVTTYNYATYHLLSAPYRLSQSAAGSIFVVYLVGIFASAWIGSLADRMGRGRMLVLMAATMLIGIGFTALGPLIVVIVGIAVVTFGFFGAHTVASSWIGLRARHAKAQASGLYFFFYYMGSSVAGAAGGVFWDRAGWGGVAGFVAALVGLALLLAVGEAKRATVPAVLGGEAA
ncbi:MAG TPA: MFS transporter [Gemmatimonadaceae bacterium]|nr:MFS transporter [Gemmatimonadaceae bacterium]